MNFLFEQFDSIGDVCAQVDGSKVGLSMFIEQVLPKWVKL